MKNDCHSYYAVGSALYEEKHPVAELLASSVAWLIRQRNSDGTWGGQDALDKFISTIHATMSLLAIGFPPDSELIGPAIDYLVDIDTETQVTFFYRSGVLLNLNAYQSIVRKDAEYLWNYRRRIGVHRDYPTLYFLLKLMKFAEPPLDVSFDKSVVVREVIEEWNESECWYGRTSLTSMALALVFDEDFHNKRQIISGSKDFLERNFVNENTSQGHFHPNVVDDSFTVYNLCERWDFLNGTENGTLRNQTAKAAARIVNSVVDNTYWESIPPFGGSVGPRIYPTAVVIRAILSFYVNEVSNLRIQVSSDLLGRRISDFNSRMASPITAIQPFWGEFNLLSERDFCFVLMPFTGKLTEIYERYIKKPIESHTKIRCQRADDIFRSTLIMRDIWRKIAEARFIIADMTEKNPNVFYELGLAHSLGKAVILVSQNLEDIPFDLQGVRTIIYEDAPSGYDELAKQIVQYVGELPEADSF
ncbi:MAG TPA: hypothetical protein PKA76_15325 [Pirellulaceae bacterium]|nr:hypothetical protein [Pyrinomonadaceae bacterium]HMP65579.1 hypothetical protein [Pyrinomonadaceae bacterium]HMP70716.1 hypothetical protein [Pirellulaceae bacterium]